MRKSLIHLMEIGIAWPSHFLFTTFWTCTWEETFCQHILGVVFGEESVQCVRLGRVYIDAPLLEITKGNHYFMSH
jgi:hypothetical protein